MEDDLSVKACLFDELRNPNLFWLQLTLLIIIRI